MVQSRGMDPDLELLDRWCAGDAAAGSALFKRYYVPIGQFFANKLQSDIEELVQSTFLACVKRRDHFRRQSSFRTFLFAIARFTLYEHLRKKKRNAGRFDPHITSLKDLGTTPRTRMARQERSAQLLQALCSLPLDTQILLELFYWERMDHNALSQVFDIEPSSIRSRLHRARSLLRTRMADLIASGGGDAPSLENLDAWARALRDEQAGEAERADGSDERARETP